MGELLEALLACKYTLFKMLFWLCSNLELLLQRWIWVRGVISQHSAEMEIGAGLCVSVPSWRRWYSWWLWEGEEGQQSLGLSPVYKRGVSEVCSFLTLLTPWVRCLCWGRVESIKKGNSISQFRGLLPWRYAEMFWLFLKDSVKCSVLLCCVV